MRLRHYGRRIALHWFPEATMAHRQTDHIITRYDHTDNDAYSPRHVTSVS